jgi:hypothetical protein
VNALELGEDDSHGYFVPMIDMLAGVIFILIIMLAAVSLVSRSDFHKAGTMQREIKQIQAELDHARQEEKTYIEPRRIAWAAVGRLLQRLQGELIAKGVAVQGFPDSGRLLVTQPGLFDGSGVGLTAEGQRVAGALAVALDTELPCLALHASHGAVCAAYAGAHLDEATVVVAGTGMAGGDGQGAARALTVLSAIAAARPALLLQQAVDKRRMLDYRAEEGVPPGATTAPAFVPVTAVPSNPPQATVATVGITASVPSAGAPPAPVPPIEHGTIELVFTMNVPPLPPEKK